MDETVDAFLFGNRLSGGRWGNGLHDLAATRLPVELGPVAHWQVSAAAGTTGDRSLILASLPDGRRVLALRRPVPGGRGGDQTTFGVFLPPEVPASRLDALAALRSIDRLSVPERLIERLSDESSRMGRPARLDAIPLGELRAGTLPDTGQCRQDTVVALIARIVGWWASGYRAEVLLDADSGQQVEAHLAAALPHVPRRIREQVSFSTLERGPMRGLAVCGLVRTLDSRIPPGRAGDVLDIRAAAEPPGAHEWDQAARELHRFTPLGWELALLADEHDPAELAEDIRTVAAWAADPSAASADPRAIEAWLLVNAPVLHLLAPSRRAQVYLDHPEWLPPVELADELADPAFAGALWQGLFDGLPGIGDEALAVILARGEPIQIGSLARQLLLARSREAIHPGCRNGACPLVAAFDEVVASDEEIARRAIRAGLVSPAYSPEALAHIYLLDSDPTPAKVPRLPSREWAQAAVDVSGRLSGDQLGRRIATLGTAKAAQVARRLVGVPEMYDMVVDDLLPVLVGGERAEPALAPSILLAAGSQAYPRHAIPALPADILELLADSATGVGPAVAASTLDAGAAPLIALRTLAGLGLALDDWELLAAAMRRAGQDPSPLAVCLLEPGIRGSFWPTGEVGLELSDRFCRSMLRDRRHANVLLGKLLSAVDPEQGHDILLANLDGFAEVYGMQEHLRPAVRVEAGADRAGKSDGPPAPRRRGRSARSPGSDRGNPRPTRPRLDQSATSEAMLAGEFETGREAPARPGQPAGRWGARRRTRMAVTLSGLAVISVALVLVSRLVFGGAAADEPVAPASESTSQTTTATATPTGAPSSGSASKSASRRPAAGKKSATSTATSKASASRTTSTAGEG